MIKLMMSVGLVSLLTVGNVNAQMSDDACASMPTTMNGYSNFCPKPRSYYEDLLNKKKAKVEVDRNKIVEQNRILGEKFKEERDAENLAIAKRNGFNSYEDYQKAENLKLAKRNGYNSYEEFQRAENERIQKQKQIAAAERERTCPSEREREVNSYCLNACRGRDGGATGAKSSACWGDCMRNSDCR